MAGQKIPVKITGIIYLDDELSFDEFKDKFENETVLIQLEDDESTQVELSHPTIEEEEEG